MATDPVLQWKTHVTDSTDQDTILGNIDLLEQFALSINGGDDYTIGEVKGSLSEQFDNIRKGIKDGTIKPTEWKSSKELGNITKALTNASSGKIATLTEQGEGIKERLDTAEGNITSYGTRISDAETALGEKLDSTDFSAFKEGDFKTTTESLGTRLDTAEGSITDHGTRIGDAEDAIKKKLDSSTFEDFKVGDFKTALGKKLDSADFSDFKKYTNEQIGTLAPNSALEALRTLLNNEISHWTRATTPKPLDEYASTATLKGIKQPWEEGVNAEGKDYKPERHIGDLCTVIGEKATDKGVSYRFVKHDTNDSYTWTKVIDNDGALALGNLKTFEEKYNQRQEVINNALDNKQRKGNYVEKTDFDKNNTEVAQEIQALKGTYKVTVTTQGEIRNGEIIGGTTHDGKPAIVHTAHVYGILGNKITDAKIINKLTWTVNSGRTSYPVARTVKGATCYVTAKDFVRVLHTQGSNPQYYDIELNSSF
ncbi:hypothetical protein [uncultured Porphyromonas sp.]|uniref:hypothetical protein n=1 Tax=uncultured Porphyromonas sp. TaxID=159274 RepID=UPI002607B13E|nr:hypothetical protein [uncultured Porphyromonas sp.]